MVKMPRTPPLEGATTEISGPRFEDSAQVFRSVEAPTAMVLGSLAGKATGAP